MPSAFARGHTDGADTTITSYYSATAAAPCTSAAMDGMVCQIKPGGDITGGGSNPTQRITTTTTYSMLGDANNITEISKDAAGTLVTRTTATTYDPGGRVDKVTISGGLGTATPIVKTIYDATSGRVIEAREV